MECFRDCRLSDFEYTHSCDIQAVFLSEQRLFVYDRESRLSMLSASTGAVASSLQVPPRLDSIFRCQNKLLLQKSSDLVVVGLGDLAASRVRIGTTRTGQMLLCAGLSDFMDQDYIFFISSDQKSVEVKTTELSSKLWRQYPSKQQTVAARSKTVWANSKTFRREALTPVETRSSSASRFCSQPSLSGRANQNLASVVVS